MLRPEEAQRPYTVTELANEIRRELRPLTALLVKGEVSGMKRGTAGHFNFSIQDGVSRLDAVLFADEARRVTTLPEDGQVFVFRGRIDFFGKTGRLSFIVDQVEFDDVGKLRAQLEELKRRLESQGAFAPERKRRLPFLPRSVALLTSPTGAVIHDLQQTIWERYPNMGIVVYPVQVQGAAAPMSIARALRRCNHEALADVIVPALIRSRVERLARAGNELGRLSPVAQVARREEALRERRRRLSGAAAARLSRSATALASRRAEQRLERALAERFAGATRAIAHRRERLVALSPDGVLARGYSITQDAESGVVIRSASGTGVSRRVRIRLGHGRLGARVDEVET